MIKSLLSRWPLIQKIRDKSDGTGPEAMTERTLSLQPRNSEAQVARSVCPYCEVGCGQLLMCDITLGRRPRGKEALDFRATKLRAA